MTEAKHAPLWPGLRWMERLVLIALGLALGLLLGALLTDGVTPDSAAGPGEIDKAAPPITSDDALDDGSDEHDSPKNWVVSDLNGVQAFHVRYYDRLNVCAITSDGTVLCAGEDGWGELTPPPGLRLRDVSIGHNTSCGVTVDRTLTCWGANSGEVSVPGGFDRLLDVPEAMFCALRLDGLVSCFEFDGRDWTRTGWTLTNSPFVAADGFPGLVCGIHADGTASCVSPYRFASENVNRFSPPADATLTLIRVSHETVCGLDVQGRMVCWGRSGPISREAPDERFVDLTLHTSGSGACGLRADNSVVCWGESAWDGTPDGLQITSLQMSAGHDVPCGTTIGGRIACWGWQTGESIHDVFSRAFEGL